MSKRVILIDALNMAFRCAHVPAFMGLRNLAGTPTGVIHGFLTSMLSYCKPNDDIVVAWDTRSHRKRAIYPQYKAHRDEKDLAAQNAYDDVIAQLEPLRRILTLMGIEQYKCDGYEADEIIGSLSFDQPCTILSEDKDFLQLVSETVNIWQPIRRRIVNTRNFAELYHGLTPQQYFVFRQVSGDASDGIAGVQGCGEKTGIAIAFEGLLSENKLVKRTVAKHGVDNIIKIMERNESIMILNNDSVLIDDLKAGYIQPHKSESRLELLLSRYELTQVKRMLA